MKHLRTPLALVLSLLVASSMRGQPQTEPTPTPAAAPTRVEVVPQRGLGGTELALLLSGQQGGQIAVSWQVFPPGSGSGGRAARVPWVADLPGPTLASLASDGRLELSVAVYALRGANEVVGHEIDTVRIMGIPSSWQADGGLKLLGYVDATPAPTVLRVLVRDAASGAFGNWETRVPVVPGRAMSWSDSGILPSEGPGSSGFGLPPGAGSEGTDTSGLDQMVTRNPSLLGVIVPEARQPWVVVGLGGVNDDAKGAPFSLAGEGAVPSTRPVLNAGAKVKLTLLGYQMAAHPEWTFRVERSDGKRTLSYPAWLVTRLPGPAGEFERLVVTMTLPGDLAPGEHVLEVVCRIPQSVHTTSIALPFRVPPAEKAEATLAWPAVPVDENGKISTGPAQVSAARTVEDETPPALRLAYREAVARYAADGSTASLRALVDVERASLGPGSSGDLRRLTSGEVALAHALAKRSPEALLGLCLVHLDLYLEHSHDLAYLAIGHSRRIVEEMAEILAASSSDEQVKREAADVLTVFAGELLSVRSYGTSERLFVRAATIDKTDLAALMGRGGMQERFGDAVHAIGTFERVLAVRPTHAEAALRLGVNQHRAHWDKAARATLQACTAADRTEWVRAVAWQELAALLLEDGDTTGTVTLLRTASAALPADRELAVMLAAALDHTRANREALALVNTIVDRPANDVPSARSIYGQWPHEDLDATRSRLDAQRPQAFAALAAAQKEGAQ
ncbi:MAG: tetratricopeptide repeat protein [Thermoanaerobaculales bacterium]